MAVGHELDPDVPSGSCACQRRVRIRLTAPAGLFGFRMGAERAVTAGENALSGFVMCHGETLFLVGFDQARHENLLFSILSRPPEELLSEGVKLAGMQSSTLPFQAVRNGRAYAKRCVLIDERSWVHIWKEGRKPQQGVIDWLHAEGHSFIVGLVAPLLDDDE